ncbi:ribonucleotide reductase small chain [Vibrio phage 1.101.O._10N.261.45.C6]|nr:ribonucleotide reductase small chain [Vibrio phage 1.101.O._10N.261.45.C6]
MTRPLFDIDNDNNNNKHYPLFLGRELGLMDNTHVTHKEIARLRDKMLTDNWKWDEISLAKDAKDIQNSSLKAATDVMIKNLAFQYLADSVAECSINILDMFCSNTEMEGLLKIWSWNEYVHAMTYSEIVKTAFVDSNHLLEEIKTTEPAIKRLEALGEIFEDTRQLGYRYQRGEEIHQSTLREQILLFMAALTTLEAVSFATSFAATFAVGRSTKAYDGIIKNVQLIARDELETHVKCDLEIFRILRKEEGWEEEYQRVKPRIQKLFDNVLENEAEWAKYLFSEGRQIVGLNERNIFEYAKYLAAPVMSQLDLELNFEYQTENTLPWMSDYLDLDGIAVAAQEGQLVNYKVNVMHDDDDGEELEF